MAAIFVLVGILFHKVLCVKVSAQFFPHCLFIKINITQNVVFHDIAQKPLFTLDDVNFIPKFLPLFLNLP